MNLYLGFGKKFLCPKANVVCQTGTPFVVYVNFIANKCQRKCRKSCDVVAKVSLEKNYFRKRYFQFSLVLPQVKKSKYIMISRKYYIHYTFFIQEILHSWLYFAYSFFNDNRIS